jgi:protein-tyrosine phosphatase
MRTDFYWINGPWEGRLGIAPRPRGGDWLADEVRDWHEAGIDDVVSLLTAGEESELELQDEARLCREQGISFFNEPIGDRGVPTSRETIHKLAEIMREELVQGHSVLVHCRQGIGRSTMMAAAIMSGSGMELEQALSAIEKARGRPVPDTSEQRAWISDFWLSVRERPNRDVHIPGTRRAARKPR